MTKEIKEIILAALGQYKGDNYERAKSAWGSLPPEVMNQKYGQSDYTRQEILDGYRKHWELVMSAIAEIEEIKFKYP